MQLSCASPMVPGASLTEQAENLRNWGFDAIAVFMPYGSWDSGAREELFSLQARTGVRPCEFVFMDAIYGHLMDPDERLRKQCHNMYYEAASVCAELDMVTELEFEYGPQDPMPLFEPYQQMNVEQRAEFIEAYNAILDAVVGSNARVLLEPINRYESRFLNSVADSVGLVEEINHPNAGLLMDFFHMSIEEADLAQAVRMAGTHIGHVHLADNNRLLPGYGSTDWASVFDALRSVGFDGVLNLECATAGSPSETLPSTATFLRQFER